MMDEIDFTCSEQYTLSVRLGEEGFTYAVFNPLAEQSMTFGDYTVDESVSLTANLKKMYREVPCLGYTYKCVNVLVPGKRVTFVPLDFFDEGQTELLFYYNHRRQDQELVRHNVLHKLGMAVLFGVDQSAYAFVHEQCPSARFYAQSSPLLDYFAGKSHLGNSRKMYVFLSEATMGVYVYDRERLLLANVFACSQTADRIYYLLYMWKQLGFDQERDELHLAGACRERAQLFAGLKRYVRQVFISAMGENLDLQTVVLCE